MAALLFISELEKKAKYKYWLIFFFLKKRNCLTSDTKTYLCHIMKLFPIILSLITGWYQSCYWSCYFWCGSWLHRPVILTLLQNNPNFKFQRGADHPSVCLHPRPTEDLPQWSRTSSSRLDASRAEDRGAEWNICDVWF